MNWTSGYRAEIDYTAGYYREMNPLRLALPLLNKGIKPPSIVNACELGFGNGINLLLNSASSNVNWYGCDFSPSHVAFCKEAAKGSNLSLNISDEDFKSFCNRNDLPDFDYICLHGVWSWISDENRTILLNFIKQKLKVGGILYISYNVLAGWSNMIAARELLTQIAERHNYSKFDTDEKVKGSLQEFSRIINAGARSICGDPKFKEKCLSLATKDTSYIAHELFNEDWHPMSFLQVSDQLQAAKLDFAASASYIDDIEILNLTKEQTQIANSFKDANLRENIKDHFIGQSFRKDLWVKGSSRLSIAEIRNYCENIYLWRSPASTNFDYKVDGYTGTADLEKNLYDKILDCFNSGQVLSMMLVYAELCNKVPFGSFFQAIMLLAQKEIVVPCNAPDTVKQVSQKSKDFNSYAIGKSKFSDKLLYLCSPINGGAVKVSRFSKMFMEAERSGALDEEALLNVVYNNLIKNGENIIVEDRPAKNEIEAKKQLKIYLEHYNAEKPSLSDFKVLVQAS